MTRFVGLLARLVALAATVIAVRTMLSPVPEEEPTAVLNQYPFYHPRTLQLFEQLNAAAAGAPEKPQLRNIDVTPVKEDSGVLFVLHDPSGISPGSAAVTQAGLRVLQLLDGTRTLDEVVRAVQDFAPDHAQAGARVRDLLEALDQNLFLFDTNFRLAVQQTVTAFAQASARDPITMGGSYPADPTATRTQIADYLAGAAGGAIPKGRLRAIVAPHIDYQRGHETYGAIYGALQALPKAPRFVILGTAHQPSYRFFAATRKQYVTSLGAATTDQDFLDGLVRRYPHPLFEDEFLHRGEHSIELEIPFLQALFGADVRIVPILCGSLHEFFLSGQDPLQRPEIADFISALRQTIAASEGDTILIAASDLSHMGPHFGDQFLMNDAALERVRATDSQLLARIASDDPRGLISDLSATTNATRWCGVAPIYTMLETLDGAGRNYAIDVLKYQQCTDEERFTTVTIPAIAITQQ